MFPVILINLTSISEITHLTVKKLSKVGHADSGQLNGSSLVVCDGSNIDDQAEQIEGIYSVIIAL